MKVYLRQHIMIIIRMFSQMVNNKIRVSIYQFHLKDFKINGSIGGPGKRDKLLSNSFAYQFQKGKLLGFQKLKFMPGL